MEQNKPYILTPEDIEAINKSYTEDMITKTDVEIEEKDKDISEKMVAYASIDPKTGMSAIIGTSNKDEIKDSCASLAESLKSCEFGDISKFSKDEILNSINVISADFNLTNDGCLHLLNTINDAKNKNEKVTYSSLPEEVKNMVDKYLMMSHRNDHSVEANSNRNYITAKLIDEFVSRATKKDPVETLRDLYNGTTLSMDLFTNSDKRIEALREMYDVEEDVEKKSHIAKAIAAITDSYHLTRMMDSKIKIKPFYLRKPKAIYGDFLFKYANSKVYNIYDLSIIEQILQRHIDKNSISGADKDTAKKFLICFALYCYTYSVNILEDRVFMYFVEYNIILLDSYKGELYTKYAIPYLNNIIAVVNGTR